MGLFPRERLPMAPIPERFVYLALAVLIYSQGGFIEGDVVFEGGYSTHKLSLVAVANYLLNPTVDQFGSPQSLNWQKAASHIRAILDRVLPDWVEGGLYPLPGCPLSEWPPELIAKAKARAPKPPRLSQRFDVDSDGQDDPAWA